MFISRYTIFVLVLFVFVSCNSEKKSQHTKKHDKQATQKERIFSLKSPTSNQVLSQNDTVFLHFRSKKNTLADSIHLVAFGEKQPVESSGENAWMWPLANIPVGKQNLRIRVFYNDSLAETVPGTIFIRAGLPPAKMNYKVVREFWHDDGAYTQGLFFYEDALYESTGQRKQSSLRKLNPETGEILQIHKLAPEYFGEGITRFGDEIFMLTYTSRIGFVFDLNTFNVKREFDLQTFQGWGLTSDSENLILSDGSASLYYYDPGYFTLIRQQEICDHKGLVTRLNELEYTSEAIYANVYTESYIVKIDIATGAVLGTLDLSGLIPENIPDDTDHVLNGIAYNPNSNTFFITGKYWPLMYEIQLID